MKLIRSAADIEALTLEYGFLPFFKNDIPGFSVAERTPTELWFADGVDGPWEWKGPVIRMGRCAYGKFFHGKAGYVSLEWLPDLVNYRRDGYDFDARCDEGLAPWHDRRVYENLAVEGSMLSRDLKNICGYGRDGLKGFDAIIQHLQMQTYVCVENFEYSLDKHGAPYGWGVARYALPEHMYGREKVTSAYGRSPAESFVRMTARLSELFPFATETQIRKLLK